MTHIRLDGTSSVREVASTSYFWQVSVRRSDERSGLHCRTGRRLTAGLKFPEVNARLEQVRSEQGDAL